MTSNPKKIDAHKTPWRAHLYEIIFKANTPDSKLFDIVLLWTILLSVATVMLESVASIGSIYGETLHKIEWFFTILFTIEYLLRCISVRNIRPYIFSFFGIIDLLAVIPSYLSLLFPGAQLLLVIRALRLLRVFRILKLVRYVKEMNTLIQALKNSRDKIVIFLFIIVTLTIILGTMMYLIEGERHGFTSIPRSVYWCIVTMTTVGYGDITPLTVAGQFLASMIMILGYSIIVIPTGIFSVEFSKAVHVKTSNCPHCGKSLQE